jgi:hypothetical protein
MLDCVSWDSDVNGVATAFALTFDDANTSTFVVSISQSGSPGQIISVESAEDNGELVMHVVLGERDCETSMLLARRIHVEAFKRQKATALPQKLMLLLSLENKDDSTVIPVLVQEISKHLDVVG